MKTHYPIIPGETEFIVKDLHEASLSVKRILKVNKSRGRHEA